MPQVTDKGDFSKGSIPKQVLRLALPIIIAELVQVLYSMVDRMFIGHIPGSGTAALTGVGLVMPFVTIITAFANLCSYGGATLSTIARGEKDDEKASHIMENAFTLLIVSGILVSVILVIFAKPLLLVMGADSVTLVYALDYFYIYITGSVFVLISLGMNSYITLQGYPTMGMVTVLIGAVLNTILDPIFMFVFNLGIKGAAIATVLAQLCSALWVVLFLCSRKVPLRLRRLRLEKKTSLEIMSLGVSGFCFKATNALTQAVVNVTLKAYGGIYISLYIASMSLITSLRDFANQPIQGVIEGSKPVISYNMGAKRPDRVDRTISFTLSLVLVYNTLIWALMMLVPSLFIRIFSDDVSLIELSVKCVRAYFLAYFVMSFQSVSQHVFVSTKHPGYAVFFSLFRKVFLILPFTIIFPAIGMGAMGVFYAEMASEVVGGICAFTVMLRKVWIPIRREAKAMGKGECA